MTNSYSDLIHQTFEFPQEGFQIKNGYLEFHDIPLREIIEEYGTPLRISYLPNISRKIELAKKWFSDAIQKNGYDARHHYCYCTKSSHFRFVMDKVLSMDEVHLETSSAFDIDIIRHLSRAGQIKRSTRIICNGFKTREYLAKVSTVINNGYPFILPVLDNVDELSYYEKHIQLPVCNIGVRVATEEEPNFQFYTSRLGISRSKILDFYKEKIHTNPKFKLRMLHFFVDKGIRDSIHYWNEFKKAVTTYCQLKKICPELNSLNIGGGLPIRNSLGFEFDYSYMVDQIVSNIKQACDENQLPVPNIYTEFGSFTVGESGAVIFSVIGKKQQNDAELWYMIDNSIMNTLPDVWGIDQRFILLPINKWDRPYNRVNIGGITCDNSDYYNSEAHVSQLFLPKLSQGEKEPLFLGFFHTGAYQESIAGHGGIQHCLIPYPKHVLVDRSPNGKIDHSLLFDQQSSSRMLSLLGY